MQPLSNSNGSSVVIILGLLASFALGIMAFNDSFNTGHASLIFLQKQKEAYYAAEGTRAVSIALTGDYLGADDTPTAAELTAYLKLKLEPTLPSKYKIVNVQADIAKEEEVIEIPSGPYKGFLAPQSKVHISYEVKTADDYQGGRTSTFIESTSIIAQVGVFQFMIFADSTDTRFVPGPAMTINGRFHTNGNVCFGNANATLALHSVSASGSVRYAKLCNPNETATKNVAVATDGTMTNFAPLRMDNSHGCTNCAGSGMDWAEYALATWHGRLTDSAHGVQPLSLPLPDESTAQLGIDGTDNMWARVNDRNLRFIVDHKLPDEEEAVSKMKFSVQADIRIIDGVWYIKDPQNELSWPGLPIWSDHPGTHSAYGLNVGQRELRARWNGINTWPVGSTPRAYSYYEFNPATESINDDGSGVISYGTVHRQAGGPFPEWKPGFWLAGPGATSNNLCRDNPLAPAFPLTLAGGGPVGNTIYRFNTALDCGGGVANPTSATLLLNATRSGFRELSYQHFFQASDREERARVLPMNFDAKAFEQALANKNPGELGSYFGAGSFLDREFNGILYMSNSWPGSDEGYSPRGIPRLFPVQGQNENRMGGTVLSVPVTSPNQQRALPRQLCSDDSGMLPGDAGRRFDGTDRFQVPHCSEYNNGANSLAYTNVIRIMNGANLQPSAFPKGLSLVSNNSAYVLGSYNLNSDTSSIDAAPWMPSLIAADNVTAMSNGWSDHQNNWSVVNVPSPAESTVYNSAFLTSQTEGYGLPYIENWRDLSSRMTGSFVMGYSSVYHRSFTQFDVRVYWPPDRILLFDPHFRRPANQPPGAPTFFVTSVIDWRAN